MKRLDDRKQKQQIFRKLKVVEGDPVFRRRTLDNIRNGQIPLRKIHEEQQYNNYLKNAESEDTAGLSN